MGIWMRLVVGIISSLAMANTHSMDFKAGSSKYLSIAHASRIGLGIKGNLTFQGWLNLETNANFVIVSKWNSGASQRGYLFRYDGTNLSLQVSNDGTNNEALTRVWSTSTSVWYHVTVTWDASASTATFYVNGASIGTSVGAITSIYNSTADFQIGALSTSGIYSDGKADDIRVFNTILSAAEIAASYNKQLVGDEANLQGYWKLNNTLTDSTANGNTLTNNNAAVFSADVPF